MGPKKCAGEGHARSDLGQRVQRLGPEDTATMESAVTSNMCLICHSKAQLWFKRQREAIIPTARSDQSRNRLRCFVPRMTPTLLHVDRDGPDLRSGTQIREPAPETTTHSHSI